MKGLDLTAETYRSLLRTMLRIRIVEEKIADFYPEEEMRCPVHLCIGQEAIAVGVCANLTRDDYVLSGHRSHGHYLAKGGDLKAMMAEIYGKATGCAQGKGGSMHLTDISSGFLGATPIVGGTIPVAAGVAFGSVMRNEPHVTVVFFGDAAAEEGILHESLNFASLKKLPVVFVCENNLYSTQSPLSVRQPQAREIFQLAQGHDVDSFQGDGNDVIEVYKLAEQAIDKARQGGGPTFLEFKTYRWREHVGPYYDFQLGYRTEEEFLAWKECCPIKRLKDQLLKDSILYNQDIEDMTAELEAEMNEAISFAKESPFPPQDIVFKDIYRLNS